MSKQDRVDFYNNQIKLEEIIYTKAEDSIKGSANILIRELVQGIALDSKKHATMLKALVSMHTQATPSIAEEVGDEIKNAIEEHIKLEAKAIKTYEEYFKTLDDEAEKIIVKAILNDEVTHHSLLKTIHKMIVERLTLSSTEFWDMVQEDDEYGYISYSK
jgi:rubrerythrin